jgi:hypothetical protein
MIDSTVDPVFDEPPDDAGFAAAPVNSRVGAGNWGSADEPGAGTWIQLTTLPSA